MKLFPILGFNSLIILLSASLAYSAELWLYCGSLDNYTSTELTNPLPLMSNTCYDEALDSIFYIFGYNTSPQDEITEVVIQSYLTVGTYNVFLINWEEEADPGDSAIGYVIQYPAKAIPNALKVGKQCGQAIDMMSNNSLNLDTTHILGHSLGAHVAGRCGDTLQESDKNASRITGMDPAGPGFTGPLGVRGLTPSCATFVDAYHTDPGVFGIINPVGQADFWFNCNNKYQPKCANVKLIQKDSCSHLAINYYVAEAVVNPLAFAAAPSSSCTQWTAQGNTSATLVYISEYTDPQARGNYYLRTNAESPYGLGPAGAVAST